MNIRLNKYFIELSEPECVLENVGSNDDVIEVRILEEIEEEELDFNNPLKVVYLEVSDKFILKLRGNEVAFVRMNVGLTGILNCSRLEYEVEVPVNVYTKEDVNDLLLLKADKLELKSTTITMEDGSTVEKCMQDRISQESRTAQSLVSLSSGIQDVTRRLSIAEGELDTFQISMDAFAEQVGKLGNLPTEVNLLKANYTALVEQVSQISSDLDTYKQSQAGLLEMYTRLETRVQALENPRPLP